MTESESRDTPLFDSFTDDYSEALNAGLSVTGESQDYYARKRVFWFAKRVNDAGLKIERVLDFGCGQGQSTPLLLNALCATAAIGSDVSEGLLNGARLSNRDARIGFVANVALSAEPQFDAIYMNGVLHHVPVAEREPLIKQIRSLLRPGGLFGLWENNPWNPGTRYVMSRIAFDRDAVTLTIPESRSLLRECGFGVRSTDTLFFFPRQLRAFRVIEGVLSRTMLGGQYMLLAEKIS